MPGISKRAHLVLDREHHARRIDLERGVREVAVEEVVAVLVGRDALHDLAPGGVVEQLAGVVVRDPCRELLERDIDQPVAGHLGRRHLTAFDLRHARPLQHDRVEHAVTVT